MWCGAYNPEAVLFIMGACMYKLNPFDSLDLF